MRFQVGPEDLEDVECRVGVHRVQELERGGNQDIDHVIGRFRVLRAVGHLDDMWFAGRRDRHAVAERIEPAVRRGSQEVAAVFGGELAKRLLQDAIAGEDAFKVRHLVGQRPSAAAILVEDAAALFEHQHFRVRLVHPGRRHVFHDAEERADREKQQDRLLAGPGRFRKRTVHATISA